MKGTLAGVLVGLLFLVGVSSAGAVVSSVSTGGGTVTVGMQPRSISSPTKVPSTILSFGNLSGAPVMHSSVDYAIYWDPEYGYHGDWEHLVNSFLQNIGHDSGSLGVVNAVDEQYTDKTNSRSAFALTFRGAYSDKNRFPSSNCVDPDLSPGYPDGEAQKDNVACLTDEQLRQQLQEFIAQNKLRTGMNTIFFLLTPPGVTVCLDGGGSVSAYCSDNAPSTASSGHSFCSYHSAISPTNPTQGDEKTILYAAIPWTAGGLGDFQLFDQAPGYECQDGGYDPSSTPQIEEPENPPRQQEPNQLQPLAPGPDGTFDTGLADLVINQVNVEQQDTITDPMLNAWQDSAGNEVTDECRNFFARTLPDGSVTVKPGTGAGTLDNQILGEGHYYLNDTFNFSSLLQRYPGIPCLPGVAFRPQFTSPNPVNVGDIVGFDAAESDVTLDAGVGYSSTGTPFETFPTYTWDFGDGNRTVSPYPAGASQVNEPSAFHAYQYGGTYQVTLTITDVGGNTATITHPLTVVGPPPPPAASPSSGAPTTAGSSTETSTATSKKGLPAPSIGEHVASHSLTKVLQDGLTLRYAVNEQVAGSVEVLLDSSTAKRLGIHGPTARNLPKGSPRSIVIGFAVLVTTKRGHGALTIRFGKSVSGHLAHMHRVKLTLRIAVRNAARQHPKKTTLMSVVVLKG